MGMKIILTEEQAANLMERIHLVEANLACTYTNYEKLAGYLNGKESRKIGNNTFIEKLNDFEIGVKYHRTHIIKIDLTDVITVNTNGWETNTTKDRLNQFLGCRNVGIFQKKGIWYIAGQNETLPYVDGMQVYPNGHVASPVKK